MHAEAIWNRARADLVLRIERGEEDPFLWEHAVRVARSAQRIAALPAVRATSPDVVAVAAAGLYHEAGWAIRCRQGAVRREQILLKPTTEADREHAAVLMEASLASVVSAETLARAAVAIREMHQRETASMEAQIVAEADNLEEFGLASFWLTIRRGVIDGKGVQSVIETWQRRKEYRFWDARLKDSFRFPAVRAVAERRLEKLERLIGELREQHEGIDVGRETSPSDDEPRAQRAIH